MLRLVRWSTALIVVLSAAILALRLIAGTQPNPAVELFTNPDGSPCHMPCLFGVNPDKMTVDGALRVLQTHPLTQNMRQDVVNGDGVNTQLQSRQICLEIYSQNGQQIDALELSTCSEAPMPNNFQLGSVMDNAALGNMILYLGAPDSVELLYNSSRLGANYYKSTFWLNYKIGSNGIPSDTIEVNDAIEGLVLNSSNAYLGNQPPGLAVAWSGFGSVERYLRVIQSASR